GGGLDGVDDVALRLDEPIEDDSVVFDSDGHGGRKSGDTHSMTPFSGRGGRPVTACSSGWGQARIETRSDPVADAPDAAVDRYQRRPGAPAPDLARPPEPRVRDGWGLSRPGRPRLGRGLGARFGPERSVSPVRDRRIGPAGSRNRLRRCRPRRGWLILRHRATS